jgi:hypothetical protein
VTGTQTVVAFFHAVDRRDWAGTRRCLTDTVTVDYTSLFGGSAEQLAADDLLTRWRGLLPGFDATQHLLGPIAVTRADGDRSTTEFNVRAYHKLGSDVWLVAGRYELNLTRDGDTGWLVSGITLHVLYQDGDPRLVSLASDRANAQ